MLTKTVIATALSSAAMAALAGAPVASATPHLAAEPVGGSGDPGTTEIAAPPPGANARSATARLDLSSAAIRAAAGSSLVIVIFAGGLAYRRPIARPHGPTHA